VHSNGGKPAIVFVTVCTNKRKNILCSSIAHRLLVQAWHAAESWLVGRYVIMPDHIHLFCSPNVSCSAGLEKWVQYWKAIVTREWSNPEEKPLWQKSFWDTQLRNNDRYDEKWEYVLENPVRAGLCAKSDNWLWQGELKVLEWY
jgi:REP element-mobilizing transposase RayT